MRVLRHIVDASQTKMKWVSCSVRRLVVGFCWVFGSLLFNPRGRGTAVALATYLGDKFHQKGL